MERAGRLLALGPAGWAAPPAQRPFGGWRERLFEKGGAVDNRPRDVGVVRIRFDLIVLVPVSTAGLRPVEGPRPRRISCQGVSWHHPFAAPPPACRPGRSQPKTENVLRRKRPLDEQLEGHPGVACALQTATGRKHGGHVAAARAPGRGLGAPQRPDAPRVARRADACAAARFRGFRLRSAGPAGRGRGGEGVVP